jgi:uncharacterized membrane protein YsdA (DUF1294 family)
MKNSLLLAIAVIYTAFCVYSYSILRLPSWFYYFFIAINTLAFTFYGIDKLAAIKHWQRIPEKNFYLLALFCAWPASVVGQIVFNHKTSKVSFRRWFYTMSFLNIMLFVVFSIT